MPLSEKFVALDFKTTNYSENARIISCSIVNEKGDILLNSLVNSSHESEFQPVSNFHNITMDEVLRDGISESKLFAKLAEIFDEYSCVVIYNANFDTQFIPKNLLPKVTIYCAMEISVAFINQHISFQPLGNYLKLNCLASLLDINTVDIDTLTSLGDAELCRRIWIEMSQVNHPLESSFKNIIMQYENFKSGVHYDL